MAISARKLAIASDLFALGDESVRIVHGVILHEAEPWAEHGDAQLGLGAHLRQHFHRASGRGGPGGWWILTEVDVELARHEVYRPDVVGWRRERVPERPRSMPKTACRSIGLPTQVERSSRFYQLENGFYLVALQAKHGETV